MPRVVRHPLLKEPMVFPTGTPDTEIYNALYNNIFAVPEAGPVPKEEAGFFGGLGEGITTLGGLPEAVSYLTRPTAERRKAAAEAGESEYEFQRLKDIEGLGGLGRFVKEQAGSALGFIAAPVAAAGAAARFAPAPIKPFAATGAFLTAAGAQYLTDTTTRQATEQEARVKQGGAAELPNATKIGLTSAAQAGLDVAGFRLFRPLGELIGLAGRESAEKMAKEVAEATAKDPIKGAEKLLGKQSIAKGIVGGAAFEAAQEVAQQALERYGAGLDLASDDAIEEYIESAVGGGLLGGPIGGVSTYAGNVRKGIYNKDYIQQVADAVQGKAINLGEEWDQRSKQIQIDTPAFDLTDNQGNFLPYTPDLLERIGINPEAKAINVGGRKQVTIPMSEVLKADTSDKTIGTALLNMFRTERFKISEEIKRDSKRMEPEELAEKIKEYETLTASLKSYEALFNPKQSINSPTNFVVQPSPADANKFVVFNPATNENATKKLFASSENAQRWIDKQLEKENKGKLEPEVKAAPAAPAAPTAPTTPTETPEETAARQAQEARDQLYKDLAARYPNNPEAVAQITQAAEDLETTMSPTEALAQAEKDYLATTEAETAPKETIKKEPEDVLDFGKLEESLEGYLEPEVEQARQNYVYNNESKNEFAKMAEENAAYQDALQQNLATLPETIVMYRGRDKTKRYMDSIGPYLNVTTNKNVARNFAKTTKTNPENWVVETYSVPRESIVALGHTEEREFLVNMYKGVEQLTHLQKPMSEEDTIIEGGITTPPPKLKSPRAAKKSTGKPYEKYITEMRDMLAGIDPESGLAEDLNEFISLAEDSKDTTVAKELSQLAATYAQATRDSTNPKLSQTEQDNALQRASNIFNMLQEMRDRVTPTNAAEMKAAKDATGNAETGNKVAAKVTKDVCG